jgi:hypothetical protein
MWWEFLRLTRKGLGVARIYKNFAYLSKRWARVIKK